MRTIHLNLNNQIVVDQRKKRTIDINQIIMLRSFSNYTCLYLQNGKQSLITHTLKRFENLLSGKGFIRVHRGYLVNQECILRLDSLNSQLILTDGHEAEFSRRIKRRNKQLKKILTF